MSALHVHGNNLYPERHLHADPGGDGASGRITLRLCSGRRDNRAQIPMAPLYCARLFPQIRIGSGGVWADSNYLYFLDGYDGLMAYQCASDHPITRPVDQHFGTYRPSRPVSGGSPAGSLRTGSSRAGGQVRVAPVSVPAHPVRAGRRRGCSVRVASIRMPRLPPYTVPAAGCVIRVAALGPHHNAGGRTGSLTADIMTVICYQGASMLVLSGHITRELSRLRR